MSITRRRFLLGTTAGLILPSFYEKAHSYFANHGEPLLRPRVKNAAVMFAKERSSIDGHGFDLFLGDPEWEPPDMTLAEYHEWPSKSEEGYLRRCRGEEELYDGYDYDYEEDDWAQVIEREMIYDLLPRSYWPSGMAHQRLAGLDLGQELKVAKAAGELQFFDDRYYSDCGLGVKTNDGVTLSLLQHRLDQLGENLQIKLYG